MNELDQRVEAAIAAIAAGEMVVVTDDDDRENEGDLVMAAAAATPEKMAFIIRNTCGIVCAPVTPDIAQKLHLDPMVASNNAPLGTAFTITVDVKHGTTTGISAEDRTATVRALANDNMGANDFARPGHVFPLVAKKGGVLLRSGHTEAAVDLCRLANQPEVGVICELVNDDGTVKRGDQVKAFADEHKLVLVSVADLIAYRQRREKIVIRMATFPMDTIAGRATAYAYRTPFDRVEHLAVVFGDIDTGEDIPVRFQRENILTDVFGDSEALNGAIKELAEGDNGILVYLREGSTGVAASSAKHQREDEDHISALDREEEWREIGLGAQILKDLGVRSIKLQATKNRHYVGLDGFGLKISEINISD
ncbi:3,4-dihydroxy-2-butanone-4-phosphate synthase [Maritalea sp.]|jgi:3,4-dihydroxy 2-butanone 4-phosphate synthase/GTP cyclohydrolase II|uniref:3,4-dihydroxy-2-butanone-4-phosphate synthase n=1 Tax=Maritalea sp. TaxID=2003361 RepID=UPI0039E34EE6